MTVSDQTSRTSVVGTAAVGQEVPFTFPITNTSDLVVKTRVTATGVEVTFTETTEYTVVIAGDTGGTVTMVTAVATTSQIHVIRVSPFTQILDLVAGGTFNAENIEDAVDKVTKLAVELNGLLGRSLRFPDTDPAVSLVAMPNAIDRASKVLGFDATGAPNAQTAVPTGSVAFTAFGESIAEAANALTAKPLLNLDHYFDVRDYDAVGDGTTDDTTEIQAAIDAANTAGGGTVVFPPTATNYQISSALTLKTKVSLLGIGNPTIQLADSSDAIMVQDGGTIVTDMKIEGIIFDGNGSNQTRDTNKSMFRSTVSSKRITIQNCQFNNASSYAVWFNSVPVDVKISKCRFYNCKEGGVSTYYGIRISVTDCTFDNTDSTLEGEAALISIGSPGASPVGSDVVIANNILNCKAEDTQAFTGIAFGGANATIEGNTIDGNDGTKVCGINVAGGSTTSLAVTITGNSIRNTNGGARGAIEISCDGNLVISGNNFTDIVNGIMVLHTDLDHLTISNNTFQNYSGTGIALRPAAGGGRTISEVIISGNNFFNGTGTISEQSAILFTHTLDNISVIGNMFKTSTRYGIEVGSSAAITGLIIANNIFSGTVRAIHNPFDNYDDVIIKNNIFTSNTNASTFGLGSVFIPNSHLVLSDNIGLATIAGGKTSAYVKAVTNMNVVTNQGHVVTNQGQIVLN